MNYNFFIIGGDKRNLLLAKRLSKNGENVKIFGFNRIKDSFFANNNIKKIANEKFLISELKNMEKKGNKKIIIGPIPYSIDGKTLYAPFNDKNININLLKNEKIIAGKIPSEIADKESIDILKDECFTIKNTVPTAEGAIAKAIELTDINIFRANVMVLGFGRVGKTLCYKLKSLGANVYAEARNEKDLAWIDVLGYKAIPLEKINENLCKMNIIDKILIQKIIEIILKQ